jgi:hypothetical protein
MMYLIKRLSGQSPDNVIAMTVQKAAAGSHCSLRRSKPLISFADALQQHAKP